MLINKKGNVANPTDKELAKHPDLYREVLNPMTISSGNMFNIEQRAKVTKARA